MKFATIRPWTRPTAALLLAVLTASCVTWHGVTESPRTAMTAHEKSVVRFQKIDRTQVVVRHPVQTGDSIIGLDHTGRHRRALATTDVVNMEIRRRHMFPVLLLVTMAGAVVAMGVRSLDRMGL